MGSLRMPCRPPGLPIGNLLSDTREPREVNGISRPPDNAGESLGESLEEPRAPARDNAPAGKPGERQCQAPSTPRQSLLPKSARLANVTKFPGDARNFAMVTRSSQSLDSESGLTPGWEHDSLYDGATWGLRAVCPPSIGLISPSSQVYLELAKSLRFTFIRA